MSEHMNAQVKKTLSDLAILAALLPEDSEEQNLIIDAIGKVAEAISKHAKKGKP